MQDPLFLSLRGRWKDTYRHRDGTVVETPWQSNQIQNGASLIVSALLRRADEDASASWTNFDGAGYLAVGSGLSSWDATPPSQSRADTTLTTETFRKQILPADLGFLDPALPEGSAPVATIQRKWRTAVTLLESEANGDLREFGIFMGAPTATLNSGHIFNWIVHPLITKTTDITITRVIEVEIVEPT